MTTDTQSLVRGTIIKVPDQGPGLLIVDGAQKPFTLERVWKSAVAPSVNQVVAVETDGLGAIVGLTAIDAQRLAKERAQEHGKQAADLARKGVGALAARMGKVSLAAAAVLWIAWFFLPALKFSAFMVSRSFTFWDVLGADVAARGLGEGSHGFFALIGIAAIVAPFVAPFLRHPRARFLYAAPLVFLVITFVKVRWAISSAMGQASKAGHVPPEMQQYVAEMTKTAMKALTDAISIGFGSYVLVAAALVLALRAFRAAPVAASE